MSNNENHISKVRFHLSDQISESDSNIDFSAPGTFSFYLKDVAGYPYCLITLEQNQFNVNTRFLRRLDEKEIHNIGEYIKNGAEADIRSAENEIKSIMDFAKEKGYNRSLFNYEKNEHLATRDPTRIDYTRFNVYNMFRDAKVNVNEKGRYRNTRYYEFFRIAEEIQSQDIPRWMKDIIISEEYQKLLDIAVQHDEDGTYFIRSDSLKESMADYLCILETIDSIVGKK